MLLLAGTLVMPGTQPPSLSWPSRSWRAPSTVGCGAAAGQLLAGWSRALAERVCRMGRRPLGRWGGVPAPCGAAGGVWLACLGRWWRAGRLRAGAGGQHACHPRPCLTGGRLAAFAACRARLRRLPDHPVLRQHHHASCRGPLVSPAGGGGARGISSCRQPPPLQQTEGGRGEDHAMIGAMFQLLGLRSSSSRLREDACVEIAVLSGRTG